MVLLKEKLNNRYLILCICFLAFGFILVFRLFNLQIVNGEKYSQTSEKRLLKETVVKAPRGMIYDRNGMAIAINRQGYSIDLVKTSITTAELNEMLLRLAKLLEEYGVKYANSMTKYLTFDPLSFNGKSEKAIKEWETNENKLNIPEKDIKTDAVELFEYLRKTKFKIDDSYTSEEAYKIMVLRYEILIDNWNYTKGGTISIATDVSADVISKIEEMHHLFPGVITSIEPIREYVNASDEAHVLGYIRAISTDEYEALKDEGYSNNDLIGKAGVEKSAERYLRGTDGKMSIEVGTTGIITSKTETVPAIPGNNIILTLDTNLQKTAMESLARNIEKIRNKESGLNNKNNFGDANAGSVVVLDVNSGEVLAMVSYPTFDPQIFLESSDNVEAQKAISSLSTDENKPEYNRAIKGIYAPGSTFKPLTAISALEKGVITPERNSVYDPGYYDASGRILYCLEYPRTGHGLLTLKKALETSCNIYFYDVGVRTTIDVIDKWADYFGLGKKTGVDLPDEKAGMMSSKELKKKLRNDIWRPADTAQVSIGQFDNAFTPLQIANYISTIANGGKRYTPYIVKKVVAYDGSTVNETVPSYVEVPVKESTINAVKEGMIAVAAGTDGTAYKYFTGLPFQVAGKTGTAQTSTQATHSANALFVCYAPADDPQIAIAVVVERGAWGSNVAPIARDIIDEYFGLNRSNSDEELLRSEEPLFNE